ncbi:PepSY domain-containing protein [uncultured Parasphingopyxis sp.]|uniref:PepSY-associated TM helix domain-containing protein n=1 Tax=uncultured Parasphingopyxis sp. TaxID=1547918 RepID=UPI002634D987|nr:PepSY-associated TM helix domain-containing protein [uncultured Parasphingopyxis sp.]
MYRVDTVAESDRRAHIGKTAGRVFWFRLHSAIGANLAFVLAFLCATGTLAVFAWEIDWLAKPEMRAEIATPRDDTDWTRVVAAAAAAADREDPGGAIETIETGPSAIFAPTAYVRRADGGLATYYFDPRTGEFQGRGGMVGVKSILRAVHSRLAMPGNNGVLLVSAVSILLLVSLITAMLFHRKWWRGFVAIPRRRKGARVFWGDCHRMLGAWSLAFGIVMAGTGLIYLSEVTIGEAPEFEEMGFPGKAENDEAAAAFPRALATVRAEYPDLSIRRIDWPGRSGAGFVFYGQDGTLLVRPQSNGMGVDIASGEIVFRHSGSKAGLHRRIAEAADPIHMGHWGGYPSRTAWFLFGAMLTGLALSGGVVAAKRAAFGRPGGGDDSPIRWAGRGARRGIAGGVMLLAVALVLIGFNLPNEVAFLS